MQREELGDDPRFSNLARRIEHMPEVDALVGEFTMRFDKQPLFELLIRHRVPCAPVRDLAEVVDDPHLHARRALEWVEHPLLGRVVLPNSPLRFAGSEPLPIEPTGALGRDNVVVYRDWLGLPQDEVERLKDDQVI